MAILLQVVFRPGGSPSSESVSHRPKTPTATTPGERPSMVMNPSDLRGETVALPNPNSPTNLGKLSMPNRPAPVYDPYYDGPIYDPYYDGPRNNPSTAQNRNTTATTPGTQTSSIQNRVDQGLSLVQGVDGLMYLVSSQDRNAAGVIRSVNQLYGATNTFSTLFQNQGFSNFMRNIGPYAGMGLGAATLFTGQGWNSFQGAAGNVNTGLQLTQQGLRHFTSAGATGLTTATQMAGGVMGGVGAYYSAKELFSLWSSGTMSGTNMLRTGAAAVGLTMGVSAAAATTASLIGGSAFLTGLSTTLAMTGWGAPIAGAIIVTTAVIMALRSRKINQQNKVDDSVLTEIKKHGIEGLGHEKYRSDDKWKEVFKATDEFAKLLPTARDSQGKPFKDASGQPYTMESFKNAPAEVRMQIRTAVGQAILQKIDSGGLDTPGASDNDKQASRERMAMVAITMMTSTRDSNEGFESALKQAPPTERQAIFNKYVEVTTKANREIMGDPHTTDQQGKVSQGFMKRQESTKTQWDWMQVEFAQKAAELGVQFAPDWATPPVDQKKYQELKKKESKKGFEKLEGGDKLDIKKYELAQKAQGQPMRFGPDNIAGNMGSVPQGQPVNSYAQPMPMDPYAAYSQGQQYPRTQRISTTPKYRDF